MPSRRVRLAWGLGVLCALAACRGDGDGALELGAGGPHPEPPGMDGRIGALPDDSPSDPTGETPDPVTPGAPVSPSPSDPTEPAPPASMAPSTDGGVPGEPAPVAPCGDDPQTDAGAVVPEYSSSGDGGAFDGDPGADGPYAVLRVDAVIDNPDATRPALNATFYAPAEAGVALDGPLPLLLVMHGFATNHVLYEHFSNHLASHGLLVLGITLPPSLVAAHDKNADEAIAAIDFALGSGAPAGVRGRADAARIAVAGHSLGGKIAFFAAALDPRIDLVIGWDPSNAGGPPCFIDPNACNDFPVAPNCMADDPGMLSSLHAESLIFRAAPDGANPEPDHNALHFFRGAPAPATLIDYDSSAAHGDWANALGLPIEHTKRVQLALLLARFRSTSGLDAWLPHGAELESGAGVQRVLYK